MKSVLNKAPPSLLTRQLHIFLHKLVIACYSLNFLSIVSISQFFQTSTFPHAVNTHINSLKLWKVHNLFQDVYTCLLPQSLNPVLSVPHKPVNSVSLIFRHWNSVLGNVQQIFQFYYFSSISYLGVFQIVAFMSKCLDLIGINILSEISSIKCLFS